MYGCERDHKEDWVLKSWCFWTVVLKKTLESPLDSKEIKPINPKGNQSWIFIGRTDAEAEVPIVWPPDKNQLIWKDPEAGKDWRLKEKRAAEDEMVNIIKSEDMNLTKLWEIVEDRGDWCVTIHEVTKKKQLNNNIIQTYWKCRIKSSLCDNRKFCYQWIKKNCA